VLDRDLDFTHRQTVTGLRALAQVIHRVASRAPVWALAAALLLLAGGTAAADDDEPIAVRVERIAAAEDDLIIDLAVDHLIDPSTERVIERGIPVTLVYEIEVWRERSAWFDRLESAHHLAYKLQLDVWDEVYKIRNSEGGERAFADLAAAQTAIERQESVPIAPLESLKDDEAYYLTIEVALKPLTVEDVDELEGWLSGEVKSGRRRGIGILGLPKALFGLVMSVTGFGDRNDAIRTPSFGRDDLYADASGELPEESAEETAGESPDELPEELPEASPEASPESR
jgi:hypothetical protein